MTASEETSMKYVDITPTWSGILPVMLEANRNIHRKLDAVDCDGAGVGWCSIHDSGYADETGSDRCDFERTSTQSERWAAGRELRSARDGNEQEFVRLADLADRYVATCRAHDDLRETGDTAAFFEALTALRSA